MARCSSGEPLAPPLEHQAGVMNAAFSPDGTRIVTVDATVSQADRPLSTRIQIWDANTGKPLAPPLEQPELAWTALRVGDLGCAAEVSADPGVRAWDIRLAGGTLADWSAVAARSPYVLVNGVLMRRTANPTAQQR
ncbi:MAG TPA: WD40 repeat domain-containing protein [Kofleriaceae bacterium]|jgi:WD40 repeat protein|nr:WD40 repeat domain-containing protein [Kofleriaceae bacterium]